MSDERMRVEFRLPPTRGEPAPKPGAKMIAEQQAHVAAARRARQLALAHHIDGLIRTGEVADLAAVARMCGVSRSRVSKIAGLLEVAAHEQEKLLQMGLAPCLLNRPSTDSLVRNPVQGTRPAH